MVNTRQIEIGSNAQVIKALLALRQDLIDFIYDAEGDLAVALETYVATHANKEAFDIKLQNIVVNSFITEGKVGSKTPLDIFIEENPNLSQSDRLLLEKCRHSFTGLFEVIRVLPEGFEVMNWVSAKHYLVMPNQEISTIEMSRWDCKEILLTRIAPINDDYWTFFSDCISKGKLGKPKLAVAVGKFKDCFRESLYKDAPDLLEQAWESVAQYHQEFVEFFGSDRVTLAGYQLNKKINELQEIMSKKRLAAVGIDESKSLSDIMQEKGIESEEVLGTEAEALKNKPISSMMVPKVDLPAELKKAEQVTAFSHPRWGQMFISTYSKLEAMLAAEDVQNQESCLMLVRKYLQDPQINCFIFEQLKQQYPRQLELVLQTVLERPNFSIERDLKATLSEYNKPSQPELPDIASVPKHLHDLFQEAVAQVQKSESKNKKIKKTGKGFQ